MITGEDQGIMGMLRWELSLEHQKRLPEDLIFKM